MFLRNLFRAIAGRLLARRMPQDQPGGDGTPDTTGELHRPSDINAVSEPVEFHIEFDPDTLLKKDRPQ